MKARLPSARTMAALPAIGSVVVAWQVAHALNRSDLPSLTNQDPSGVFGRPGLPPLHLVAMGDSTITAPGVEPLDACVARRAAIQLADRYRVRVTSVGQGGSRVRDALIGQLPAVQAAQPDLVLLSLGANDALHGTRMSSFRVDFDALLSALSDRCPVVVGGVGDLGTIPRIPASLRWLVRRLSRRVDTVMSELAAKYPNVTKAVTWTADPSPFQDAPHLFADDRFHANADGHAVFAEGIRPSLEAALNLIGDSAPSGK